jgi:hypothetical protein
MSSEEEYQPGITERNLLISRIINGHDAFMETFYDVNKTEYTGKNILFFVYDANFIKTFINLGANVNI